MAAPDYAAEFNAAVGGGAGAPAAPPDPYAEEFRAATKAPASSTTAASSAVDPTKYLAPGEIREAKRTGKTDAQIQDMANRRAQGNATVLQSVLDVSSAVDPFKTKEQSAALNARKNAYESQYGHDPNAIAGRLVGNALAEAPFFAVGGELVGMGGEALANAVPKAAPVINALTGASTPSSAIGRYAAGGVRGAVQGAAANALVGQDPKQGAVVGGGLGVAAPMVGDVVRGAGRLVRGAVAPYTESGRNQLAQAAIDRFASGPLAMDASEIVPGSQPTLAEATGDAGVAGLQRALINADPKYAAAFAERAQGQADQRGALFDLASGTKEDIARAMATRDAAATVARNKIFANAGQADVTPVFDVLDAIASGTSGKRPAVASAVNDVKKMIGDSADKAVTDPATLYDSVRKGINDLISGKDLTKAYGAQAASELITVRDQLDKVIDAAAPGFEDYLSTYSAASRPIDAMQTLQGLNITDQRGNITLAKVQSALRSLEKQRDAAGAKAAKSVAKVQIGALEAMRDDLLRGTNKTLGMPTNSSTLQNYTMHQQLPGSVGAAFRRFGGPQEIGTALGAGIGSAVGGPVGAAVGGAAGLGFGHTISGFQDAAHEKVMNRLAEILLNPQQYARPQVQTNALQTLLAKPEVRKALPYIIPSLVLGRNRLAVPVESH